MAFGVQGSGLSHLTVFARYRQAVRRGGGNVGRCPVYVVHNHENRVRGIGRPGIHAISSTSLPLMLLFSTDTTAICRSFLQ